MYISLIIGTQLFRWDVTTKTVAATADLQSCLFQIPGRHCMIHFKVLVNMIKQIFITIS